MQDIVKVHFCHRIKKENEALKSHSETPTHTHTRAYYYHSRLEQIFLCLTICSDSIYLCMYNAVRLLKFYFSTSVIHFVQSICKVQHSSRSSQLDLYLVVHFSLHRTNFICHSTHKRSLIIEYILTCHQPNVFTKEVFHENNYTLLQKQLSRTLSWVSYASTPSAMILCVCVCEKYE